MHMRLELCRALIQSYDVENPLYLSFGGMFAIFIVRYGSIQASGMDLYLKQGMLLELFTAPSPLRSASFWWIISSHEYS